MAYSRLLNLGDDIETKLKGYLKTELVNSEAERGTYIDKLISWQRDYWAEPSTEVRTFPFRGAANLIIPLTAIAVESTHARTMTTLKGLTQFCSVKSKSRDYDDTAPKFEAFMDHELLKIMKFVHKVEPAILEIEKFGTGIAKTGYCKVVRYAMMEQSGKEFETPIIVKQGVEVNSTPMSRFVMPFYCNTIEEAPWVGEEYSWTKQQFEDAVEGGLFYDDVMGKLDSYFTYGNTSPGDKYEKAVQDAEKKTPQWPEKLSWYSLYTRFDVQNSGRKVEIIVYYELKTDLILGVRYNLNHRANTCYHKGVYFPVEHRWSGIGLCKQLEQFQKEITTQHRQRLDNGTLANMRMFKISKMSGYGPKEPIFPGKFWFLDDMTHIEPIQMGEVYPSAFNNESSSLMYSQQRSGVNDLFLGMQQTGTPGTATSDLSRLQEGRRKYDYIYGNIKEFLSSVIVDIACLIQQYGPRDVEYYEEIEGGLLVKQYLALPTDYIKDQLVIEITAAGEHDNKLTDRNNWIQVAGIIKGYFADMIGVAQQMAQLTNDTTLYQAVLQKSMGAGTEALKQILETFDVNNVERIAIKELLSKNAMAPNGGELPNGNGTTNTGFPNAPTRMAPTAQVGPGPAPNSNGQSY